MTDYDSMVNSIAAAMGIDAEEVSKRMKYLSFEDKDVQLLLDLHGHLENISSEFVEQFYTHILSFPETQSFVPNQEIAERLRESQDQYFKQLTSGNYNWHYVLNRLTVGLVHQRIGLEPKWYLSAFNTYLSQLFVHVCRYYASDIDKGIDTITALLKIIFFDMGLALESYFYAEKQLAIKANEFGCRILSDVVDGIVTINEQGIVESFNPAAEKLFGYAQKEIVGKKVNILMPELISKEHDDYIKNYLETGKGKILGVGSREVEGKRKDGTVFPMDLAISEFRLDHNRLFIGIVRDVSARKKEQEKHDTFARVIEQTADLVMITDPDAKIIYVNPAFEALSGYSRSEVLGKKPNMLKSGKHELEFYQRLWDTIISGESFREVFINKKKDGALYYEERTITPILDESGKIIQYVSTGKDITERLEYQERFNYVLQHDALTELPNRSLIAERLDRALLRAEKHNSIVALVVLDIDRFKTINDSMGHEAGDNLLIAVADRLISNVREGDTVARLAGDEFAILLDDIAAISNISPIIVKILSSLQTPFLVNGQELFVTASIGISCYPDDGKDFGNLLKHADVALHRVKDTSKNNYQFYSSDMGQKALQRLEMEKSLRRAIDNEEFVLFYQPQYNILNGEVKSVEALVRWQHPEKGLIPPLDFIPLLEETDLIVNLGEWTIGEVARQYLYWQSKGLPIERISINISGRQFSRPTFIKTIKDTLVANSLAKDVFEVEITESSIMRNPEKAAQLLQTIRGMGIRIAMDDFGTGYSSLSYLQRFPIDTLKIDKSFVDDVSHNQDSRAITKAIIALAKDLNLKVIAEGIETQQQLDLLHELGCNYIQGYLISRPVDGNKIVEFFNERNK